MSVPPFLRRLFFVQNIPAFIFRPSSDWSVLHASVTREHDSQIWYCLPPVVGSPLVVTKHSKETKPKDRCLLLASQNAPADYVIGVRTRGERMSGTPVPLITAFL